MSGEQLELFENDPKPTGRDCPFWDGEILEFPSVYFRDICTRGGKRTAVICSRGVFGEPPKCAYSEPDNSDAACQRRLEWMKRNGSNN